MKKYSLIIIFLVSVSILSLFIVRFQFSDYSDSKKDFETSSSERETQRSSTTVKEPSLHESSVEEEVKEEQNVSENIEKAEEKNQEPIQEEQQVSKEAPKVEEPKKDLPQEEQPQVSLPKVEEPKQEEHSPEEKTEIVEETPKQKQICSDSNIGWKNWLNNYQKENQYSYVFNTQKEATNFGAYASSNYGYGYWYNLEGNVYNGDDCKREIFMTMLYVPQNICEDENGNGNPKMYLPITEKQKLVDVITYLKNNGFNCGNKKF